MFKKTALLFTLLASNAAVLAFDWHTPELTSRLWKISKNGQPDSHLIGTMHIGRPDNTLSPKLESIVRQSDLLVSEVVIPITPDRALRKDILAMQRQMFDTESGKTLSDKIGAQTAAELAQRLQNNPKTRPFADKLPQTRPWAAMMLEMNLLPAGYSSENGVDFQLSQAAVKHKVKRTGLEHYADLPQGFKKLPLARIIEQIDFSNRNQQQDEALQLKIAELYYGRQYRELMNLSSDSRAYSKGLSEESIRYWQNWLEQEMLTRRNRQWMPELLNILPKQKTLIAVGTAHLVDDSGLINQLRRHGYTVEPISE